MAYVKTTWKERLGQLLDRYRILERDGDHVRAVLDPLAIDQEGTSITANRLNKMEQGIYEAHYPKGVQSILDFFYPVGTIFETTNGGFNTAEKVSAHFGGTWEVFAPGRVLVGVGTVEANTHNNDGACAANSFSISENSRGGARRHTLTVGETPRHNHFLNDTKWATVFAAGTAMTGTIISSGDNDKVSVTASGSNSSHNNMQPYETVYRYRRVS